jgi:hypothetical protein
LPKWLFRNRVILWFGSELCVGNQPRQASRPAISQPRTNLTPHTTHHTVSSIDLPTACLALVPLPASSPSRIHIHTQNTRLSRCCPAIRCLPCSSAVLSARHALLPLRHHWVTWCCVVVHSLAVARGGSLIRGTCPHRIPFTFHTPSHVPLSLCTLALSVTLVSCQDSPTTQIAWTV